MPLPQAAAVTSFTVVEAAMIARLINHPVAGAAKDIINKVAVAVDILARPDVLVRAVLVQSPRQHAIP